MSDTIRVEAGGQETLWLIVEHRGRVVMRTAMRAGHCDQVSIVSVQTSLVFTERGRPHVATAELRTTVEDIAAWVAGDGTDEQRLALADGIRRGWSGG